MAVNKSLRQQVWTLVWPAMLQGLLSTVILFTDRLILGSYSDSALGSMQVSGPVLWSLFSIFGAYSIGVLAVIGRGIGAQEYDKSSQAYATSMLIALTVGGVVGVLGYVFRSDMAAFLIGERGEISAAKQLAEVYLGPVFLSGPLLLLGSVTFVAFQASGDTKTPMWLTFFAGGLNLFVSWVLVFGKFGFPDLGILGASIGTVCANVSNAVLGVYFIHRHHQTIRIVAPSREAFRSIMKIAWPAFGEKVLFHTGFLVFAGYIGRLGDLEMATHQAMMAIESLGFIGAHAFGIAAGALVAQKLGAKNPLEAQQVVMYSAKLGFVSLSVIGVFFYTQAEWLIGLFSQDPAVIGLGVQCMTIAAVAQPLMAFTDVYGGALRGAGDTKTPLKVAILGPLIVRPIACYYLAFTCGYGLFGIWIGSTLDWVVRSLLLYIAFRKGKWKHIKI